MEFLLIRAAFFALSAFTFLTSAQVLKLPLHFPWLVLFVMSFGIWLFWEIIYKKRFFFPKIMGGFFLLHLYADVLGNSFKLYGKFFWYDRVTHTTGGATFGALMILILGYFNKKRLWNLSPKILLLFALSLTLSLCVLYEFWEFYIIQTTLGYHIIAGVEDTMHDLIFGLLGAAISIIPLTFILKRKSVPPPLEISRK